MCHSQLLCSDSVPGLLLHYLQHSTRTIFCSDFIDEKPELAQRNHLPNVIELGNGQDKIQTSLSSFRCYII